MSAIDTAIKALVAVMPLVEPLLGKNDLRTLIEARRILSLQANKVSTAAAKKLKGRA